ncbi:Uncharacterized protein SCF082_LOCUS39612 [Durusdinium trenchii]|uniref:Uncharacterized protein n=1 Tax=Durusdinium trenchii TaxID=1381693 RepID=A0ABP0Q870_9DINO
MRSIPFLGLPPQSNSVPKLTFSKIAERFGTSKNGRSLFKRNWSRFPSTRTCRISTEEPKSQPCQSIRYKSCFEYTGDLHPGDNVNFKVAGLASGSFTIDKLPQEDATLVLVVYRHDRASMALSFMSHVFAKLSGPQVALLDAYQGTASSLVEIQPEDEEESAETLRFNSVMALDEARYKVLLHVGNHKEEARI